MSIVPQLIVNSLIAGSIYALLAMGFNLIYGTTKFFNFGYGAYAVIGAYGAFTFVKLLGWPDPLGISIAVVIGGLIAFILDKTVNWPLRKRKATASVKLVASIGIFTVVQALVAIFFSSQFQTLAGNSEQRIYQIGGAAFSQTQLIMFLSAIFVLLALTALLKFTLFGKAVKAISDDEEVAKIVGINTDKVIGYVFFLGASIAGWAGIITAYDTGMEPTMGLQLFLKAVVAAMVGGLGGIPTAFFGAFVLGFLENFGIWKINGEWKDAIAYGLLILVLLFRPQGLFKK